MKCVLFAVLLLSFGFSVVAGAVAQTAPRPYASRTPPSLPAPTKSIYEILKGRKDTGKFVEMIGDAGLKDMFAGSSGQPMTVFVPTDAAMSKIPRDVMKHITVNEAGLQSFVEYHVIANTLVGSNAIKGRKLSPASANGEALQFDGTDRNGPAKINDGTLVEADIPATNGVIHVVNTALAPPSLVAGPVAPPKPVATVPPPVAPIATAQPVAPAVSPVSATTTPAMPPAETTTGAVPEIPPAGSSQTAPPAPIKPDASTPPASDDTGKGFSVFGHKFGW